MNVVCDSKGCTGCGVCVSVCPHHALTYSKDQDGFYVPKLDAAACVDCARCVKVCPLHFHRENTGRETAYYYGAHTDAETRSFSTSGGAFKALADGILAEGGLVIGARYSDDWRRVEAAATDECGLKPLQRTKYCQCRSVDIFDTVEAALKSNRRVMTVSTPCVAAALRNRFGDAELLLIVDFMCGGVTPEKMLSDYTQALEQRYRSRIAAMNMRDKSKSWEQPTMRVDFENGKTYLSDYRYDPYLFYYYSPYFKNEPCLDCAFIAHADADITLGDFWGFRKEKIENDGRGMSLVCAHTEKGRHYVDRISAEMKLHPLTYEAVSYAFREKSFSAQKRALRLTYLEELRSTPFVKLAKRHEFRGGAFGATIRKTFRKLRKS